MPALARPVNGTVPMRAEELKPKHHLLVEYMVHGLSHPSLCERTRIVDHYDSETGEPVTRHPRVGEALDLMAAAEVLRIKRRDARRLSKHTVFARLLATETQAFRDGAKARAWRRIDDLVHEPGQGKAADRKVQLAAATTITGEHATATTVNLNIDNRTQIKAGVVIRLPATAPAKTIDHGEDQ